MKSSTKSNIAQSSDITSKRLYLVIKRLFDIVISLSALIIFSPLFILFAVIIFFSDFHNPFYRHERVGRNGKKFKIIKFRSMYWDAHDFDKYFSNVQKDIFSAEFKISNDPRITPVGRFIRKFSIDELPQLVNVFAGQMSLIGPRPLTEEETYFFGDERNLLLSVRPGITGMWQVSGRNALTYESGERQKTEIGYIKNYGFKTDVKIFFKTFAEIFRGKGQ